MNIVYRIITYNMNNIYYFILKSIKKYANIQKVYINTSIDMYINNTIGLNDFSLEIEKPYYIEIKFKKKFYK